jgi:hypothetical protein
MTRFGLLLCLLAALMPALGAQEDAAPDTQAGNFLYKFPTGWKPMEKGDTTFLFCPASPSGTNTFIALAANDMDGDLRNSFNQLWAGFTKSYRVLEGGQIAPLHAKAGYDAFYTGAVAADQNGKRWTVYVMGAGYGKRIQTVMFMSDAPRPALNSCENIFKIFLGNLRFGDALPGATVPPARNSTQPGASDAAAIPEKPHKLPPGALEGVYVGYSVSGSGRVELRRLHFNADGWVVRDVPEEGMIGFDFTAYRNDSNTNRSWVGRYRVAGDQINIVWQDYTDDREVIRRNEASAHPALNVYVPMCRCTGKRFSGKYLWGLKTSGQYMQFFPDGTFIDHGVTDQMLVPSPYYDRPRTQRGTYSIQSQTMIFTFADGRRGMRTFIAPKAQENARVFDWIGLGWKTLYEDHYQDQP